MPENTTAFELVKLSIVGMGWVHDSDKIFYRLRFDAAHVAKIAQGLKIEDTDIFKRVVSCLSSLARSNMD